MSENFYHQELVDHFKYPKNKKSVPNANFVAGQDNPSCGDKIYIEGIIEGDKILDIGFSGVGCVISQATTSMLVDECIGKTIDHILTLTGDDILGMIGLQLGPVRIKCALLSLQVLQEGVQLFKESNKKK
jgi:nitrogen fixation protein NifU and related proteins